MTQNNRTTSVSFELKDITINFPHLGQAWTPSFDGVTSSPQWSIQVTDMDIEDAEVLKELGVSLQETEEGPALNLRAYVTNARGEPTEFNVYDGEFNEMSLEDRSRIGYGSRGHVVGYLYKNNFGGVTMRMTDVVITELVERDGGNRVDSIKKRLGM